jgi:hypothetical protein
MAQFLLILSREGSANNALLPGGAAAARGRLQMGRVNKVPAVWSPPVTITQKVRFGFGENIVV